MSKAKDTETKSNA
jgi:hypothetical protein